MPDKVVDAIIEAMICAVLHKLGETTITVTQDDLADLAAEYYESSMVRHDDGSATFHLTKKPSTEPRLPLDD